MTNKKIQWISLFMIVALLLTSGIIPGTRLSASAEVEKSAEEIVEEILQAE